MIKRKITLPSELAYIIGLILICIGVVFTEKANFGMDMIVAPAYLIHLKISEYLPFFTFGMSEYCFQGLLLLILMIIVRKFKLSYFLSFVTAVLYGFILDGVSWIFQFITGEELVTRILLYSFGIFIICFGVSLMFKTYISPEVYELFVKEITEIFHFKLIAVKWIFDVSLCLVAVVLSFIFFGFPNFVGISFGTIICALINGFIIGFSTKIIESLFIFKDYLPLRSFFEKY